MIEAWGGQEIALRKMVEATGQLFGYGTPPTTRYYLLDGSVYGVFSTTQCQLVGTFADFRAMIDGGQAPWFRWSYR